MHDEDFAGCVTEYEFDVAEVKAVSGDGCVFCGKVMPDDKDRLIDEGWHPDYFEGDLRRDGPVCPQCLARYCELEQGDFVLKGRKAEFVSKWDSGHEFRSVCVVSVGTGTVEVVNLQEPGEEVEGLAEECVVLDGTKYKAVPVHMRDGIDAAEQSRMLFYE